MFVLVRALTYATLFVGLLLWAVPARILSSAGLRAPGTFGGWEILACALSAAGAFLAAGCVMTFVFVGHGTPAPFDPPRQLVVRGPYRFVRNPMYIGAGLAVSGMAMFYRCVLLAAYVVLFMLVAHTFVVLYEEPTLTRMFGKDYAEYCRRTSRWWMKVGGAR